MGRNRTAEAVLGPGLALGYDTFHYRRSIDPDFMLFTGPINPLNTVIFPLEESVLYYVVVKTVDITGNVSDGVQKSGTPIPDQDPIDVTDLVVTPGAASLIITWTNPDIPDFDHVVIWYGSATFESTEFEGTYDPAGTTIDDLVPGDEYTIIIKAVDTGDNRSPGVNETGTPGDYEPAVYALGETGPAGGHICYIDTADSYDWKYLEAAPLSWRTLSNHTFVWATSGYSGTFITTTDTIDSGEANTAAIIDTLGASLNFAAHVCSDLTYAGFDDWFLPSRTQLNAMYSNLHNKAVPIGSFADAFYWSSVQEPSVNVHKALYQDFANGTQYRKDKVDAVNIRPMRSFTFDDMVTTPVIASDAARSGVPGNITITCGTPNADIYYTTDDSEPSETNGTLYSAPFSITAATIVKAIGIKGGWDSSSIAENSFTL